MKLATKAVAIIALATSMTSCLVTQKYEGVNVKEEQHLFRLDSLSTTGQKLEDMATVKWSTFYQDPILKSYIDTALKYNYSNQIAFKNIAIFTAQFKQGKMGQLPRITLQGNGQRQKQASNSQFGSFFSEPFEQYTISGTLSWEADLWGKINSQKLAAQAEFEKSVTAQKLLQTTLISNLANTYFDLLAADNRRQILTETVTLRRQSVETLKALKDAGKSNSLAVSQAEAQLYGATIQLRNVENQVFALENALATLVGKAITDIPRRQLDEQRFPEEYTSSVPVSLLSNRPDILEAELDFRKNFEQVNVARASMYPTIVLSAEMGLQSLSPSTLFGSSSFFNTLTGGLTQPLFQKRRLKTQKEVAIKRMEISKLQFQEKVLNASIEVSNLLNELKTASANLEVLEQQEVALQNSFEDSQLMLVNGLANYLDVLNAQSSLLVAQLATVDAQNQKLKLSTQIFKAIGGGVN
ncbi:efflux transporter outer membrane subunit [bacterium SCSIO 12741]|nr:efflux transporter outer membrane subunit [bacterium SCSIO 12741]